MSNLMRGRGSLVQRASLSAPLKRPKPNLPRRQGSPLPEAIRRGAEELFGEDFSDVRLFVSQAAPRIGAVAFTSGSEIHLSPRAADLRTPEGVRLIGHELAHVVQQRKGKVKNTLGYGVQVVRDQALEADADRMGTTLQMMMQSDPGPQQPLQIEQDGLDPIARLIERVKERIWSDVLLVDDNEFAHLTIPVLFKKHCMNVKITNAYNGLEALETFIRNTFTLVITDFDMPVMDGLTSVRGIRKYETENNRVWVPILLLTAEEVNKVDNKEEWDKLGVYVLPNKPMQISDFKVAVNTIAVHQLFNEYKTIEEQMNEERAAEETSDTVATKPVLFPPFKKPKSKN